MSYVRPIPKSAALRKGNRLVRFSWNTGPAAKPGMQMYLFPDTEKSAIACKSINMTREYARREWQKLLKDGFEIDRIPTV